MTKFPRKFIAFTVLTALFSAFGVEDEKYKENLKNSQYLSELGMNEEYIQKQRELKEEKRKQQECSNEKTDKYLGIKYWNENYYELNGKFLRIEFFGKTGTFNIYCKIPKHPENKRKAAYSEIDSEFFRYDTLSEIAKMPEKDLKEVALFSEADNSLSTGFLVKLDDEIYRLNSTNRVSKELRRTVDGAQLVYSIDHKIRLVIDFSLMSSKGQKNTEEDSGEKEVSPQNVQNEKNVKTQNEIAVPTTNPLENKNIGFGEVISSKTTETQQKAEDKTESSSTENKESVETAKKTQETPIEDIVKIKMYTINIDKKRHDVAIKGIFDTIFGEGSSVHFSTDFGTKIRNETQFSALKMEKERTILLDDDDTSFQFVLNGEGIAPVQSVILANTDHLYKMNWTPIIRSGRGFTNIRGYDDSGIMIDWPSFTPLPEIPSEHTFFIAAATNDESPKGLYYVDGIDYILEASLQKDAKEKELQAKLAEQREKQAKKNASKA